jgi:hypothetical protein
MSSLVLYINPDTQSTEYCQITGIIDDTTVLLQGSSGNEFEANISDIAFKDEVAEDTKTDMG